MPTLRCRPNPCADADLDQQETHDDASAGITSDAAASRRTITVGLVPTAEDIAALEPGRRIHLCSRADPETISHVVRRCTVGDLGQWASSNFQTAGIPADAPVAIVTTTSRPAFDTTPVVAGGTIVTLADDTLRPPLRVDFAPGDRHAVTLPYSEVCIHMRVAGRTAEVELSRNGRQAQIFMDGQPFSTPVLPGEAGLLEANGQRYGYLHQAAASNTAAVGERYVDGSGGLVPLSKLRPEASCVPLPVMKDLFRQLGYTIGREQVDGMARMMTGPCAGISYAVRTLTVHEADTGMSAFHVDARRDAAFQRMQALRGEVYSLVGHRLIEA
jgi:hypothetical protein